MAVDQPPAILYVDDERPNLRAFALNFDRHFRVVTCESGPEALSRLPEIGDVGVVLTDQRMPGMSGVELLERARILVPEARRMLVTAYADIQVVIDAVNRGQVNRYFVKPWVKEDLLATLEDAMRIHTLSTHVREMQTRLLQNERLATLGQVSAGIAHELMNPVAYVSQNVTVLRHDLEAILGALRPRLADSSTDPTVRHAVEEVPNLLDEITSGVAHIRQVALNVRSQARGDEVDPTCQLAEVADFASRIARTAVRDRARLVISGQPVEVRMSAVKLAQVILNLVVNAAQAMEGLDRPGKIELRWRAEADQVRVAVEDNGSGIPEAIREKVFNPLFTTKPAGVGTGLGLAICRDLIRAAGGDISLESEAGRGTTIAFTLAKS